MNFLKNNKIHFEQILKLLCCGLAVLIVMEAVITIWSIQYVSRQAYYNVDMTVTYYTRELEKTLEKVTDTLEELAVTNLNVQSMKYAQDNLTLI